MGYIISYRHPKNKTKVKQNGRGIKNNLYKMTFIVTRNGAKLFFGQGRYPRRTNKHNVCFGAKMQKGTTLLQKTIGTCAVCLERKPLCNIPISCNHSPACIKCLRKYYIAHSQQSIFNYPLRCLQEGCSKTVVLNSMIRVGLFKTVNEVRCHTNLLCMKKIYTGMARSINGDIDWLWQNNI